VEGRKEGRAIGLRLHWGRGEGRQGERDRCWPMTNVRDGWLCVGNASSGHDVSIRIWVGRYVGSQPRAKTLQRSIVSPLPPSRSIIGVCWLLLSAAQ
jgi:hypothetical protein